MTFVPEAVTDVLELCVLLQCLGYNVKSMDTSDNNLSQDGMGSRTIVINCQVSGFHVVLENPAVSCSCPPVDHQNSGFWQVSGISGGKQLVQESGSSLLRPLTQSVRDHLCDQLNDVFRTIRDFNDNFDISKTSGIHKSASMGEFVDKSASLVDMINKSTSLMELSREANKSSSVLELGTPEKRHIELKTETPTRYRSLDTLTGVKDEKHLNVFSEGKGLTRNMVRRQATYTLKSKPESLESISRRRNKTSSPIRTPINNLLESLIEAEKDAEILRNKLSQLIREYVEDEKHDSSISSMLDVSKISVLKGPELKYHFSSSPNLSGLATVREDAKKSKSKLKRFDSASTSNLLVAKPKENFGAKLRRLSPFNTNKDGSKDGEGKSRLHNLFKTKTVTPVRSNPSPNLSAASKKKYSHVKSTIPRLMTPTPKKE